VPYWPQGAGLAAGHDLSRQFLVISVWHLVLKLTGYSDTENCSSRVPCGRFQKRRKRIACLYPCIHTAIQHSRLLYVRFSKVIIIIIIIPKITR
jgi:hypothetical protein